MKVPFMKLMAFFEIWYVFAYNMFCVSHACFLFHIACFLLLIICQSEKHFLSTSCWGFHMGLFCESWAGS